MRSLQLPALLRSKPIPCYCAVFPKLKGGRLSGRAPWVKTRESGAPSLGFFFFFFFAGMLLERSFQKAQPMSVQHSLLLAGRFSYWFAVRSLRVTKTKHEADVCVLFAAQSIIASFIRTCSESMPAAP